MKKILFFAVSALLVLTGCSKEVAEAPSRTTSVDPYEVKPIRISISGNQYEWTNYDNPNGKMTVEYVDENWQPQELLMEDGMSELIQHEYDHLNGILATMRAVDSKSFAMKK